MRKDWWVGDWGLEIGLTFDSWLIGISWALARGQHHEEWLMIAVLPIRLILMHRKEGFNA